MAAIGLIGIVLLWALIPFGMGLYARKQGLTFWSIFLISFFLTPIVGAIAFAVDISQKRKADSERRIRAALTKNAAKWACTKCGTLNIGAFCSACGTQKPIPSPIKNAITEPKKDIGSEHQL